MRPAIKISDDLLRKKMRKYEAIVGKEVKQLVHNAARVCCVELAKATSPQGVGQQSRKKVEGAIEKDIRKIFTPLNPEWWRAAVKLKGDDALYNPKTGIAFASATQERVTDVVTARKFHRSNRGGDGRTKRLQVKSRAIIKLGTMRSLIRLMRKRAGIVKAGWGLAATLCKADVRQPLNGIPAWIKRNIPNAKAHVDDRKAYGLGWKVKLRNSISWASQNLPPAQKQKALGEARRKFLLFMNIALSKQKPKEAGLQ